MQVQSYVTNNLDLRMTVPSTPYAYHLVTSCSSPLPPGTRSVQVASTDMLLVAPDAESVCQRVGLYPHVRLTGCWCPFACAAQIQNIGSDTTYIQVGR